MNKFCYGAGLMIVALVLGVTGCAMMTMPRANQALGQRRAGRKHLRRYLWLRPKGPLAGDSRKAMYR